VGLVGIIVPVVVIVVCLAVAATAFMFFRRQWSFAETRRLQLTMKLSGLAQDEEVSVGLCYTTVWSGISEC